MEKQVADYLDLLQASCYRNLRMAENELIDYKVNRSPSKHSWFHFFAKKKKLDPELEKMKANLCRQIIRCENLRKQSHF